MADLSGLLDELEGELGQVLVPQNAGGTGDNDAPVTANRFFGPYELVELVGQGGVAKVYRATHVNPAYAGQVFAVKLLHEELSRNKQVVDFFRAEAYLLSLLRHPNIVRTFEASSIESQLYIAMEYIEGRNLEELTIQLIRTGMKMPQKVILHIISEVAKALYFAHSLKDGEGHPLGLVHRDVNPANVFLDFDGRVLLGDFGVAVINNANQNREAVQQENTMSGKVGYFAPEQFSGQSDYRADIYALGIVLYERLANHILFEGDSAEQILKSNQRAKIPSLLDQGVSAELNSIVQKVLAKDPKQRYQNALQLQKALEPMLEQPLTMKLAVAVLMRSLFVTEYSHELFLKEQNYGDELKPEKNPVLVISQDERTRRAFRDLLVSKGYPVCIISSIDQMQNIIEAAAQPQVVLVDIQSPNFSPLIFRAKMSNFKNSPAVVAMSNEFSITAIEAAQSLGAEDLLYKPYSIERVICTITEASMRARPEKAVTHTGSYNIDNSFPSSLLLVSHRPEVYQHFKQNIETSGFKLEPVINSAELFEHLHQKSYKAIIYDTNEDCCQYLDLPDMIKELPGLESLPLIYLANGELAIDLVNHIKKRTAVASHDMRPELLAQMVAALLRGDKFGRCFTRYAQRCQVALRHGGQLFAGTTENISRGGLLVRCSAVPALGAIVGVTLQLPLYNQAIEVRGRVVRVTPASAAFDGQPGTGVSFLSFAGDSEERLVSYIIYLEEQKVPKV